MSSRFIHVVTYRDFLDFFSSSSQEILIPQICCISVCVLWPFGRSQIIEISNIVHPPSQELIFAISGYSSHWKCMLWPASMAIPAYVCLLSSCLLFAYTAGITSLTPAPGPRISSKPKLDVTSSRKPPWVLLFTPFLPVTSTFLYYVLLIRVYHLCLLPTSPSSPGGPCGKNCLHPSPISRASVAPEAVQSPNGCSSNAWPHYILTRMPTALKAHRTAEETETLRSKVTCPRPHDLGEAPGSLESDQPGLKIWILLLTIACLWASTPLRASVPHLENVNSWCSSGNWVTQAGLNRWWPLLVY